MAKHEQSVGASDEWYTPAYVFEAMGARFDLDVATPALSYGLPSGDWSKFSFHEDSLQKEWFGFVWMNPPFGGRNGIIPWLDKFCAHSNGIALFPDRTSAPWWQTYAPQMTSILFVSPKIKFIPGSGQRDRSPAQGTCLGAIGPRGVMALCAARASGLGVMR